jgi:hypothetical protein
VLSLCAVLCRAVCAVPCVVDCAFCPRKDSACRMCARGRESAQETERTRANEGWREGESVCCEQCHVIVTATGAQESETWSASASAAQGPSSGSADSGDEARHSAGERELEPPDALSTSRTVTSGPSSAHVSASALRDAASSGVRRRHHTTIPGSEHKVPPESQE